MLLSSQAFLLTFSPSHSVLITVLSFFLFLISCNGFFIYLFFDLAEVNVHQYHFLVTVVLFVEFVFLASSCFFLYEA